MLRADTAPLAPSGPQARELLKQELAKPEYQERKGVVQRSVEWILDRLQDLLANQGGTLPSLAWLVGLLLLLLVVVLAVTYLRPGRVHARGEPQESVLGEQALTAQQLRNRAAEHERAGMFGPASIDYFRTLAVRSVERTLVDVAPGLTAHDIARVLSIRFPDSDAELRTVAATFDAVLYGGRSANARDCSRIRDLEKQLAATRPAAPVGDVV